MGRQFDIEHWLPPAYAALCTRKSFLTLEEAKRLDVDTIIRISQIREAIRYPAGFNRPEDGILQLVKREFDLDDDPFSSL